MKDNDERPDPKPRKHPQLWQSYLWWDELMQLRKRHNLRISSIEAGKSNMDAQFERDFMDGMQVDRLVRLSKRTMVNFGVTVGPIWDAVTSIRGLGEGGLAAQLLAQIDDISSFTTVSKLWRFAGYGLSEYWMNNNSVMAPKSGYQFINKKKVHVVPVPEKGWKLRTVADRNVSRWVSPFNRQLKSICWLVAQQFVRQQTAHYVDLYYSEKSQLRERHPERIKLAGRWKYNDGHLHNMAQRKAIKIFLQHLWLIWRTYEGLPVSLPYAHDRLGHGTLFLPEDFGWKIKVHEPDKILAEIEV